jgi:hypothetical protein
MGAERRKSLAPPGFEPRTIQLVANCYADCDIQAHPLNNNNNNISLVKLLTTTTTITTTIFI